PGGMHESGSLGAADDDITHVPRLTGDDETSAPLREVTDGSRVPNGESEISAVLPRERIVRDEHGVRVGHEGATAECDAREDGAVLGGLPRDAAVSTTAQTTGFTPAEARDEVAVAVREAPAC